MFPFLARYMTSLITLIASVAVSVGISLSSCAQVFACKSYLLIFVSFFAWSRSAMRSNTRACLFLGRFEGLSVGTGVLALGEGVGKGVDSAEEFIDEFVVSSQPMVVTSESLH